MDSNTIVFSPLIDIPIMLTYIMVGIGTLAILYFAIKNMIQLSGEAKKTLYSIGSLAVTILIAFLLSSDNVLPSYEKYNISKTASKLIGTGLYSYTALGVIAITLILFYTFKENWKKTIGLLVLLSVLILLVFNYINFAINITYLLVGSALVMIGIYSLKGLFTKSKANKKSLYTLLALTLVFGISYILASPEVLDSYKKYKITNGVSKQVGMGIITFYILFVGTFIAMIYSEFSNKTSS